MRDGIAAFAGEQAALELDYEHLPLTEQLEDHGIRQFEIDVYADPDGGRFADRPAAALIGLPTASGRARPRRARLQGASTRSTSTSAARCLTFVACLAEIEAWSAANPDHEPIMIMVETKQQSLAEATEGALDLAATRRRAHRGR